MACGGSTCELILIREGERGGRDGDIGGEQEGRQRGKPRRTALLRGYRTPPPVQWVRGSFWRTRKSRGFFGRRPISWRSRARTGSAFAAIATARRPSKAIPERIVDILRDPARKVTDIPGIGKGLALVIGEIIERQSCKQRDELLLKFPPGRARIPQDSGARTQEHRADFRALPDRHHRRAGDALQRAEAARAAAHGREAGGEGPALHRRVSPAHGTVPAELRGRGGGRVDRKPAAGSGGRGDHAGGQPAARAAKRSAISTCW